MLNKKPTIEDSLLVEENKNYFKTIFDKNKNGICIVGMNGIIKEVNHNYSKMFGYKKNELIGQHFRIITTPDSVALIENNHKNIFNGTSDLIAEEKVKRKNGTYFYIQTTNTRVNDENGKGIRITTAIDISSRLRSELVQSVLLKISKLASISIPEVELYKSICKSIAQLMPVNNFAICIKNKLNQKLDFPFILNELNVNEELILEKEFNYLESSSNSILLNSYKINSLIDNKHLPRYELRPTSIVGVPLKI
ncbi:MAG: PAS domain S-box protein [Ignavibacteriae bacterium]|nr:PAS domain S-box protein [Ignavibacteriota bacterium]